MKRSDITTLMVLQASETPFNIVGRRNTFNKLLSLTNAPSKVILAAITRELDKRLIDCGVSINDTWLTELGKYKLNELKNSIKDLT